MRYSVLTIHSPLIAGADRRMLLVSPTHLLPRRSPRDFGCSGYCSLHQVGMCQTLIIGLTSSSTRLLKADIEYIVRHSGAKLVLVDHEYVSLVDNTGVPTILSRDIGRSGDPYEAFLSRGRQFSRERGWAGLELEEDENAGASINYTYVSTRSYATSS
jgi:hypothetical protein